MKKGDRVTIAITIQGRAGKNDLFGTIDSIDGSKVIIGLGIGGTWPAEKDDLLSDGPGTWRMIAQVKLQKATK